MPEMVNNIASDPAGEKLIELINSLKAAFKASDFTHAHELIDQIKALDPANTLVQHIADKIRIAEDQAHKKAHQKEISALESKVENSFKDKKTSEVRDFIAQLQKLDSTNKIAARILIKLDQQEKTAQKKQLTTQMESLDKEAKMAFEHAEWEVLKAKIVSLKNLDSQSRMAMTWEKKLQKVQKKAAKKDIPGFFSRLFKTRKQDAIPVDSQKSLVLLQPSTPIVAETGADQKKILSADESNPGNIFTRLFKKKADDANEESIIDTIVAQTSEKKAHEASEQKRVEGGLRLFGFARLVFHFTIVFALLSAGFIYAQMIDVNNRVLSLIGIESNFASRMHAVSETLQQKQEKNASLQQEIEDYENGYTNQYQQLIERVVKRRIDWLLVINRIHEIANAVYPHNDLSQYIVFNGYSFNAERKEVTVNGTLTDPLGHNLTKLSQLEEAFRTYPRDGTNPDDPTQSYFYNVEGAPNVGKSFDQQDNRYISTFRFTFTVEPIVKN